MAISSPRASFIWVEKMVRAMPLVKPTTKGWGMKRNSEPNFSNPNIIIKMPARMVEIIRPSSPYCDTTPAMMMTKAPVGPPICTRLPPNNEIRNPAINQESRNDGGDDTLVGRYARSHRKGDSQRQRHDAHDDARKQVFCELFLRVSLFQNAEKLGIENVFNIEFCHFMCLGNGCKSMKNN